ncbi:TIGR02453 family protein [marine bacterium AO1-C]|nr:TIGR02453 family protein [marine bacterium AO1-C]
MAKITQQTFDFLSELAANNQREWFNQHKSAYEASKKEMVEFADELIQVMNEGDVIGNESGKKSIYRIHRDVRFSKDKAPYKIYWGGFLKRMGADRRGGYHFQIQPGNSFVMGGFFGPNSEDLLLLRQQIDADAEPLRDVLQSDAFKNYFGELIGDQVKTAPKGFKKDNENIDLLRYKQFLVKHSFTDKEVLSRNFVNKVAEGLLNMLPFFDVMTEYLTTDLNGISLIDR